jgi:predicted ATPase
VARLALRDRDDVPPRFQSPRELYGRERESEVLLGIWQRMRRGAAELALIAGIPEWQELARARAATAGRGGYRVLHRGQVRPLASHRPLFDLAAAFREFMSRSTPGGSGSAAHPEATARSWWT